MAKKRVVLPLSHLPTKLPLLSSIVFYMALDLYQAPGWAWGVVGTIMAVTWIVWAIDALRQEDRDLPGYGNRE